MFEATQSEAVYMKNTEDESRNSCKSEDGSWIRNMAAVLLLRYLQIKSCFLTMSVNSLEQLLSASGSLAQRVFCPVSLPSASAVHIRSPSLTEIVQ